MKYYLIIGIVSIPFLSFSQIMFTGYVQDSRNHKPIYNAKVSVKGSDVSAENALDTDEKGFFVIKFDNKSVNKSFQLKISHKDFLGTDYSEVVISTLQPKTYYLKSKSAPPPQKRPTETVKKKEETQEQKQSTVINETKPQVLLDTHSVKPPPVITPGQNDYPSLGRDPLNKTGNRFLTETDKKMLRDKLTDLNNKAFVNFQRGNVEAKAYALEILAYTKELGFTGNINYYSPPAKGRFDITTVNGRYNVNVLVRVME